MFKKYIQYLLFSVAITSFTQSAEEKAPALYKQNTQIDRSTIIETIKEAQSNSKDAKRFDISKEVNQFLDKMDTNAEFAQNAQNKRISEILSAINNFSKTEIKGSFYQNVIIGMFNATTKCRDEIEKILEEATDVKNDQDDNSNNNIQLIVLNFYIQLNESIIRIEPEAKEAYASNIKFLEHFSNKE